MRAGRTILVWLVVIAGLVLVEVAEVTRLFTLPVQSVLANPIGLVFALVFTTILALIGAIFVGIYISHRILSPRGFSPIEEEMLHMRADLLELRRSVEGLARGLETPRPGDGEGPPPRPPPAGPPEEPG